MSDAPPPKERRGGRAPPPPPAAPTPKKTPTAASTSAAGASSESAAEIIAAAESSWDERSRVRKKQLESLRQQEKDKLGKDQRKGAKDRLAYLMRQTDVFAHFMSPDASGGSGGAAADKGAGRKGKGRLTEKQEDDLMMQAASKEEKGKSASSGTRLTKQPACITGGTMRPYQLEGLNWLIKLYENGINGILADEMGLGKTLQTISLLAYLKESCNVEGPHLVITPKSTISNWVKEVQRFCPSVRAFKFIGDKHERAKLKAAHLDFGTGFDVCITTYEVAIAEKAALSKLVWRYLIIDEAHRIKNETSVLSQVVRMFSTHFRLLITGTPLQNNLHELWAMLNYLLPDIFDSSDQFDDWFSLDADAESKPEDVLSQLHKILRPFLLRRLKADVEKDLPAKREIKLLIGMSEMQRTWYASVLTKNLDVINAMGGQRSQMHNILMHLRKCANHPYLFDGAEQPPFINDERIIKNSGKVILLDKLLQKLHPQGHRVLIFSQMTRMLDILEDYCWLRRWEYCRIDGSTSTADRDEAMATFNAPGSSKFIFMLSTRAGGLGINLQTADTVVLYDSDWNPQMDLQAVDRAHRIGQTKPVVIYRFMTEGTVEEKIIERAQKKLYLDAAVIQQGRLAEQSKSLSKDEMLSMIRFGADAVFKAKDAGDGEMDYTDADIDALLARGEERTRADNERFETQTQTNSLANFSLGGEEKSLYDFDGQDWSGLDGSKGGGNGGAAWSLTLPKRKHKESYDENETYRRMVGEGRSGGPRGPKQAQLFDFQFFDTARLEKLRQIELRHWEWKQERKDEQRARRRRSSAGGGDDDDDGNGDDDDESGGPPKLTAEEVAERDELMKQGFPDWQKKDLMAFVRGCEMYGRHDLAGVALEVEGKSEREVARYAVTFFERFAEIKEWEKLMKRIEHGESKLQKRLDLGSALAKKVARSKSPFVTMRIDYGSGGVRGKQYTEEEDRFLVCMTNQLGFGSWEELQTEVRAAWAFRFDWFIRTRTADELGQRVEALARLIEKEVLELEAAERKKARAAGGGGTGAGGKRPASTPVSGGKAKKAR